MQNVNKRAAEGPHPEEPPSSRRILDKANNTSPQSVSFDIMTSVGMFLEGPHHDFDEVIRFIF